MRLSGWQLPVEFLSATSLAMSIQCPEKWRQKYVLKQPERMAVSRLIGIVDHAVHAENFRWKMDLGRDMSLDSMKNAYASHWENSVLKEGEPDWEDKSEEEVKSLGLLMMETYHTQVSPQLNPVKVEERFEETIEGVPVPIVGYVDLIDQNEMNGQRIVERKTTKQKQSKPKPAWRFQGRIYQLVYDLPTAWHVVTKQVEPKVYTPESEPKLFLAKGRADATVLAIRQAVVRLNDLYARYGADTPWPTDGLFHDWSCDYCGYGPNYANNCIAWRDLP